jgi:aryl-alcohol dehydrogenase-like predicted oxidoreductase
LDVDTIDVFYLHNPETQLRFVTRQVFEQRLQNAFERCERLVRDRRIRWYGTATWSGYREPDELDLQRIIDLALYVGGNDHHFRFIQLPFNLAMIEAYQNRDEQGVSVLKVAGRAGVTVVASGTLHQSRLARDMPPVITNRIPGLTSDAARAIQFTRSTPGIAVSLVGMSNVDHVRANLEIAGVPPMSSLAYEKLYRPPDA